MQDQDVRQKNGMQEIKLILENALKSDVVEHLKKQVEDEIAAEIDQLVAEQVVLCLKTHIPQDLQDEVAKQQKILGQVRRDLNNTENRRTNAALRSTHEDDTLQVIYKEDGTVPDKYPPNLKALFDLDATTSKGLMMEYELLDYSESRERNLNRLMQFLGVKYQMVRSSIALRFAT
ncbi:hypothetical protein B0H10DRAFT_1772982 [Mycena sp. CBHHK59/15]|nr:hypothetical protein B0H10DRAFT_1772982 [Mycena sp. CBHHK59/15]